MTTGNAYGCRRAAAGPGVQVHGPIPQADFLAGLGIGVRLESLMHSTLEPGAIEPLTSGYHRCRLDVPSSLALLVRHVTYTSCAGPL